MSAISEIQSLIQLAAHGQADLVETIEAIDGLCHKEQDEIKMYHSALNSILSLFVMNHGYDYNCVEDGLKTLALHPELPTTPYDKVVNK